MANCSCLVKRDFDVVLETEVSKVDVKLLAFIVRSTNLFLILEKQTFF